MAIVSIGGSVDLSIDVGRRFGVTGGARAAVVEILRGLRRDLREFIIGVWPVDTGASLQAWSNRISGLDWLIRNPTDYSEFVHSAGSTTEVWTEIERESESLLDAAAPDIEAAITAARPARAGARSVAARATSGVRAAAALFTARSRALAATPTRVRQARRNLSPEQPEPLRRSRRQ